MAAVIAPMPNAFNPVPNNLTPVLAPFALFSVSFDALPTPSILLVASAPLFLATPPVSSIVSFNCLASLFAAPVSTTISISFLISA
jgi:hypothetical protein